MDISVPEYLDGCFEPMCQQSDEKLGARVSSAKLNCTTLDNKGHSFRMQISGTGCLQQPDMSDSHT